MRNGLQEKRGRKRRTRFSPEVMAGYTTDASRPYHCDVVAGHCGRPFGSVRSLIMHARRSHMGMLAFNQIEKAKKNGAERTPAFGTERIPSIEQLTEALDLRREIDQLTEQLE